MKKIFFILISIILWTIFWLTAFLSISLLIIISFIIPKKFYNFLVKLECSLLTYIILLFPRVKGLNKKDLPFPVIYVANHVSFFDLFICGTVLPGYPRGLELKEHFDKPIYGWFIKKFGEIPIDTKTKTNFIKSLRQVEDILQKKERSILVMPEGHRTRNGKIGEFSRGAFYLSRRTNVPVIPVVYKGLYERSNANSIIIKPGFFDVIIMNPVKPADFKNDEEMCNFVRNLMISKLEE